MSEAKLRVLPKGTAMVSDYEAQDGGVKRFIGWRRDANLGHELVNPTTKERSREGAYVKSSEVVTVPMRGEYVLHLTRDCDLWPADEATARACGAKWDPTFGGEHEASAEWPVEADHHETSVEQK